MPDSWLNRSLRSALIWIASNPVSAIGGVLTAGGIILFLLFALIFMASGDSVNPYVGALGLLGLPTLSFAGIGLVFVGKFIFRGKVDKEPFWVDQFNIRNEKKALLLFGVSIFVFVAFVAISGIQAASFMDSSRFCGQTCHSVMEPEAVAHANSGHATARCVNCHVGEGVEGAFIAKMRGSWQLISLALDLYERPIPAPVESLPSSEDTCQKCHDTKRRHPKRMTLYTTYKDDERSSKLISAVVLNIGSSEKGSTTGIHAHGSKDLQVRYYTTDRRRENIVWVEAKTPQGTRTWSKEGETPPIIEKVRRTSKGRPIYIVKGKGNMRAMDCVDCHNRTGHNFKTAERLADELLENGVVDQSLPYAKLVTIKALEAASRSPKELFETAVAGEIMTAWPHANEAETITQRITTEARKYLYPRMNIGWGHYKDLKRHSRDEGCFRCHNQRMKDEKGKNLKQECESCHETVADRIPFEVWQKKLYAENGRKGNTKVAN